MTTEPLISTRELHSRIADGILVRLFWRPADSRVFVTVNDHKTGDAFTVEVPEHERALDVFHHPFAYHTQRTPQPTTSEADQPAQRTRLLPRLRLRPQSA